MRSRPSPCLFPNCPMSYRSSCFPPPFRKRWRSCGCGCIPRWELSMGHQVSPRRSGRCARTSLTRARRQLEIQVGLDPLLDQRRELRILESRPTTASVSSGAIRQSRRAADSAPLARNRCCRGPRNSAPPCRPSGRPAGPAQSKIGDNILTSMLSCNPFLSHILFIFSPVWASILSEAIMSQAKGGAAHVHTHRNEPAVSSSTD